MATITATITVDFIANYAGAHRVCFRIQGSGNPYDCTTVVSCVGGATTCQAVVTAPVNSTSCDGTVIFEGYIQAACEDILSTSGRLPWTANFTPNVVCERYEVLCARGALQAIQINTPGQDYTVLNTVVVTRDGADPETSDAAVSIASVGDGVINSITGLTAAGTLYNALDILTVNGASGAGATIRVDTVGGGGDILTYTLLTNGAGYIGPLTVSGGTGSGAVFDIQDGGVDYDVFGAILTFNISVGGLYSIPPTITINVGSDPGIGADLTALLEPCALYTNVGTDCNVTQVDIADGAMDVGETFATCIEGGLVGATPSVYDVTQSGCCIPDDTVGTACTDYHLDNTTLGPVDVHVTNCEGDDEIITVAATTSINRCLVTGGVIDPDVAGFIIVATGTPCPITS